MKLSGGVESALHCCVVLTTATEPVPAARLAELHGVSGSYLAKQLQALSRSGLVSSVQGQSGGYVLTRPSDRITVLDVVEAVDGSQPAFVCAEIRQRGPLAAKREDCSGPCAIARAMGAADAAWRGVLREISIADLVSSVEEDHGPAVLGGIRAWLTGPEESDSSGDVGSHPGSHPGSDPSSDPSSDLSSDATGAAV